MPPSCLGVQEELHFGSAGRKTLTLRCNRVAVNVREIKGWEVLGQVMVE